MAINTGEFILPLFRPSRDKRWMSLHRMVIGLLSNGRVTACAVVVDRLSHLQTVFTAVWAMTRRATLGFDDLVNHRFIDLLLKFVAIDAQSCLVILQELRPL